VTIIRGSEGQVVLKVSREIEVPVEPGEENEEPDEQDSGETHRLEQALPSLTQQPVLPPPQVLGPPPPFDANPQVKPGKNYSLCIMVTTHWNVL